jgi:putative two-component system protein, hydrogenase maturation factor HypX/HoxX
VALAQPRIQATESTPVHLDHFQHSKDDELMQILFISTAHNSLSQRLAVELARRGHSLALSIGTTPQGMLRDVERSRPELIIAPMLKTAIPEEIWRHHLCLIVHPGIKGDRGPSSLDWAISRGAARWGVTVLQAEAEMDAGPVWSSETFSMPHPPFTKSSLYRAEVTEAAVRAVLRAVTRVASGTFVPEALDYNRTDVHGQLRPSMRQSDRAIDWSTHSTDEIACRVRAADGSPGVLAELLGQQVYVFGAHQEDALSGPAGQVIARRHGAICVGTVDGAVWLTHLKTRSPERRVSGIKLPAAFVLQREVQRLPHLDVAVDAPLDHRTYRDIRYWERGQVGYLAFDFYNGAMSTQQCRRLCSALQHARSRPTRVICLLGGRDFWSNGIHLNVIEAAKDPAHEAWRNINAIDDVVLHILTARQLVVAGLRGNAGAGGVMLALAADHVYARQGVVLNPHYRTMGNLFGSEYWTFTLPRRVGPERALEITTSCQPMGVDEACEIGMLDGAFGSDAGEFDRQMRGRADALASDPDFLSRSEDKQRRRAADERQQPLASYRAGELSRMRENFFGPDPSFHIARRRFVRKLTSQDSP